MEEKMNKRKLLESIQQARAKLEQTVAAVPQSRMVIPGVDGENSVKDLLAHISTWERRMIVWLKETLQDREPEMLPSGMTWEDLDRWNEETFEQQRGLELAKVLKEFHASYAAALKIVEDIDERVLFDSERFPWRNGHPLWELVSANMDWHYPEHEESIRTWLASLEEK
jgi:hypothetical protein